MARHRSVLLFDALHLRSPLCPRRIPLVSISLAFACLLPFCAGAEIFKWVDDAGKVHYGDSAPADRNAETIRPPPEPTAEQLLDSSSRLDGLNEQAGKWEQDLEAKKQAKDAAQRERAREQYCQHAQSQLQILEARAPVYHLDDKGKKIFVEDDQRAEFLTRVREAIEANCR